MSKYFFPFSYPIKLRPVFMQATPVVPLPIRKIAYNTVQGMSFQRSHSYHTIHIENTCLRHTTISLQDYSFQPDAHSLFEPGSRPAECVCPPPSEEEDLHYPEHPYTDAHRALSGSSTEALLRRICARSGYTMNTWNEA